MILYFRADSDLGRVCTKAESHVLTMSFNLRSSSPRLFDGAIVLLGAFALLATWFLLPEKFLTVLDSKHVIQPSSLALVDQYFWPMITLVIAQSAASLFDYSRRPGSERHFLIKPAILIVSLALMEFVLLLTGPLLLMFNVWSLSVLFVFVFLILVLIPYRH